MVKRKMNMIKIKRRKLLQICMERITLLSQVDMNMEARRKKNTTTGQPP